MSLNICLLNFSNPLYIYVSPWAKTLVFYIVQTFESESIRGQQI